MLTILVIQRMRIDTTDNEQVGKITEDIFVDIIGIIGKTTNGCVYASFGFYLLSSSLIDKCK